MRVKIYWDPTSDLDMVDLGFFELEEGICGCGVEPRDLEDTDFIYVEITVGSRDWWVPACTTCNRLRDSRERLRNAKPFVPFGGSNRGFPRITV